jgi:O-antigen biosynthesis protein
MDQNLESQNQELKQRLIQNLSQLQTSYDMVARLERKIREMESSKFWKARRFYKTIRKFLKQTKQSEKEKSWWRGFLYLFSSSVRRLIRKFLKVVFKRLYLYFEDTPVKIVSTLYHNQPPIAGDIQRIQPYQIREDLLYFEKQPLISIVLPVYNPPVQFLREAIDSVCKQYYKNWELCIADDCSTKKEIKEVLEEYKNSDSRIKIVYRTTNGHISACSNSAIEIAKGEYLALMDHDDVLTSDALYEVIRKINLFPEADFIYSDEDKLQSDGSFSDPYYKPDWCPDSFMSRNYINHFSVIKTSLVRQVGGFRVGYEGSQDYDLFLRVTELTNNIFHIPKILYHWRIHPDSTSINTDSKGYAYVAAQKAIEQSIIRKKETARVDTDKHVPGYYTVRYSPKNSGKVSIIIPTKDNVDVLKTCIDSVISKTAYQNYEIVVVSNNSSDGKLFSLLKEYDRKYGEKFRYYEHNIPFNFASLMNEAVFRSSGELLLFLNNDTEIIHSDWLDEMVGQAERKTIGVVGCKLLYPDDSVQHAGVVIGMGGIAGHVFVKEERDAKGYFCHLSTVNNYSAVTGACMMCRKSVFEEVGGFDEQFKVEYNDIDFCLKIKEKGYDNVYLPQVELHHYESYTRGNPFLTKESQQLHLKESGFFRKKWQKYIDHDPCFSVHFDRNYSNYHISV